MMRFCLQKTAVICSRCLFKRGWRQRSASSLGKQIMPFHEKKRNLCDWQRYLKNCIHNYEWIVTTLSERLLYILTICPKKLDRSLLLVLGSSFFQFDFFEPRQVRRKFGSLEVPGWGWEKLVRDKEAEFEIWSIWAFLLLKSKSFLIF